MHTLVISHARGELARHAGLKGVQISPLLVTILASLLAGDEDR